MLIRAPELGDAADILSIVREHGLPAAWSWPKDHHGLVVEYDGRVIAFCILSESIYGLVIEELWETQTRVGMLGLGMLSRKIESIAQGIADERGEPIACGGIVRLEKDRHIAALKKRNYYEVATILEKRFHPRPECDTPKI